MFDYGIYKDMEELGNLMGVIRARQARDDIDKIIETWKASAYEVDRAFTSFSRESAKGGILLSKMADAIKAGMTVGYVGYRGLATIGPGDDVSIVDHNDTSSYGYLVFSPLEEPIVSPPKDFDMGKPMSAMPSYVVYDEAAEFGDAEYEALLALAGIEPLSRPQLLACQLLEASSRKRWLGWLFRPAQWLVDKMGV
jgi:hypothetical protein